MIKKNKKIVLGTVQLGMRYGLNNTTGQPSQKESFKILDKAFESGINTFDTGWAYGIAEDILGAWIKDRKIAGKVHIISKMKPHALNDYPDGTKSIDIVRIELEKSLSRLGVDSLDGYLLHSPHFVYLKHVIEGLKKVKRDGLVKNIGVSVYNEDEALQAVNIGLDYIQIPYNAFDQRLDATDFFDLAKKNKVTVFARSPFLQGLLIMQPNQLPDHLAYLRPFLEKFISISNKYNLTPLELSFNFVLNSCRADYIVFGVDNVKQLIDNISIKDSTSSANNEQLILDVQNSFKDLNKGVINPSLWSKIKL